MKDTQKAPQVLKGQLVDAVAKVKAEIVICENEIEKQAHLMDMNNNEVLAAIKKMIDGVKDIFAI